MKQIAQKSNKGDGNGDGDPFDEWHLEKGKKRKQMYVLVILRCSTYLQHST
jgi:hypothetical protein